MKRTLALSVLLLVLGGCTSDYEQCIAIETENIRITDIEKLGIAMENAEMRAENICYQEPAYFQNQEEIFQAMMEEEICIAKLMFRNSFQRLIQED